MSDTLTKENFWDEMEQKYPKAMIHFKAWIDQYKTEHDWDTILFQAINSIGEFDPECTIKYHELPIAMQFGIFLEWLQNWPDMKWRYTLNNGIKAGISTALMLLEAKL